MEIVMPCESLSTNSLTRAYPFAKIMGENHKVTVVGTISKQGIYPPLQNDKGICYKTIPEKRIFPFYLKNTYDIYKNLDADIIHAFKPLLNSYLPSLIKKRKTHTKLILDIDDWESQFMIDNYLSKKPIELAKFTFVDLYMPESYFLKKLLEKQTKKADAIITSSRTLQRMFGGAWIPTGPNTELFNPEKYNGKRIREEFQLENKTVILFSGAPKKHKGIQDLIDVVKELRKENEAIQLLIVGADKSNPYVKELKAEPGITLEGFRSYEEMPEFMAAADIVCIPHRNTKAANAQLPIKTFDPMAMARPVITTDTTDMKEIFQNCGFIIPPDNKEALKKAIQTYIDDKQLRIKHGQKAREECIQKYAWPIMKKKTQEIYESL
ncbi:glycosyltransferase family 4 protein [Candidatus Woesearchaeota archaeon]|nr:glycosyltransferase family 4 protein [Candidatus Woesearchaeota archaeon]